MPLQMKQPVIIIWRALKMGSQRIGESHKNMVKVI